MQYLVLAMMMVVGVFVSGAKATEADSTNAVSKPAVVVFYADWCGSCKILEPKLKQAMDHYPDIEKIVFDMTDEDTKAKSSEMATARGLASVYNAYAPKTGVAVLVNGQGVEVGHLTKTKTYEEIDAALKALGSGA